jgi:uncharacterized protein
MNVVGRTLVALGAVLALGFVGFTGDGRADGTAQSLPFSQNWTNTGLITANDNWSGVPGVEGHLGDGLAGGTGVDPQTITAFGSGTLDVIANQSNTTITNGGVAEFDGIANPVVALQGSGTARSPFLLLHLQTTGVTSVQVSYNLRDIDGTADNSIQPVALQFRVGNTGTFTNVPAGFVADASGGPSQATLVTPVSVILPAAASNQPLVQVRIITSDAVGSDEWIGIDDINVNAAVIGPSGTGNASPNNPFAGDNTLLTVATQQGTPPAAITSVIGDLTAIGQTNAQLFFDDGTNGDVTAADGTYSVLTSVAPGTTAGQKVIPTVITDALARTGSAPITLTVQSNSTAPSGVGAANPSTVPPGGGTLLTVSVTPGANPTSTGLTVIGDLTAIGQTNAQLFFDDGTNGDVTPGDNVFSVAAEVAPSTPVGGKTLPVIISDDQSRTGLSSISLIVGDLVPPVVISQVFGGGGEAGAPFSHDFVELFNRGASPADLSTWSLQYAPATGTTWDVTTLSGVLQPGRYYLVQLAGGGGGAALPAPNASGTANIDFASGKLVLLSTTTPQSGACPSSDVVDLVGYGAADCFEGMGPAPTGPAATADVRLLKGCADNNQNNADFAREAPTPRNGSTAALDCTQQQPPAATLRAINQVQGTGSASPFAGQVVRVRGTVTGRVSNGFFLQTPDGSADADADPATSEGILIFTNAPPTVNARDFVEVTGTVAEFIPNADLNSPPKTEILPAAITVFSSLNALPAAVTITADDTLPGGSIEQLEKYEFMRVRVASLTVVAPTDGNVSEPNATSTSTGVFYGVITGVARPFREPGIEVPDPLPPGAPSGIPRFDANPERLRVDSDLQTGAAILDVGAGAVVSELVGPLDYSFRTYTIAPDPTAPPSVAGDGSATPVPEPAATQLTVASYNMERFFDTVNDPGIGEPVLTTTAFNNRLNKASLIIRNILRLPDVLAVQEMENVTTLQAVANKVNADALAASGSNPGYTAHLLEGNDIGGIDVGFLVKGTRVNVVDVAQVGKDATYIDPSTGQPATLNDRPSLVLRVTVPRASGPDIPLTIIDNHLRSLTSVDDPADGDRVRTKRRAQAEFLANVIQARQVADPSERIISVGDYNAFGFNDGYVDSMGTVRGQPTPANEVVLASSDLVNPDLVSLESLVPADQRYSFMFDGNAQELDHAIVTQNLLGLVAAAARARVNSDFPEILRNDSTRPERLSDHDPLVAYINLPSPTTTSLISSLNPSTFGQEVTFTAAVTAGATPVTTGSVTFRDGSTVLGTVDLNASGQAAFTTSTLAGGDHVISASFNGNATLDASSAALTQTVNAASTTTTVGSSPNPSGQGQSVTFTATVTRTGSPVTAGTVTFFEGMVVLAGPLTLNASGQASFATSTLGVGSHTIRADYAGTPTFAASTGNVVQSVQPALAVGDVSVLEGNAPNTVALLFTVTLSSAAGQPVQVSYATQDGSATAGADYQPRAGQLFFPAGATQRRVAVIIVSDTVVEPDETFALNLSASTNAVIVDPTASATIVNDDAVTLPTLSIDDVTVREKEGGSVAVFTVTLAGAAGQAVTVAYETADGTATEPADYGARAGTLTFAADATRTIEVPIADDGLREPREEFYVVLSAPTGATLADGVGIGSILSGPFFGLQGSALQR